jgi:hypothetical protein
MALLERANKGRYGQLGTHLENQYARGTNQYPVTITEAYNLLVNYQKPVTAARERNTTLNRDCGGCGGSRSTGTPPDKLAFTQDAEPPPISIIQCYNCQSMGPYASNCCTAAHVPRGGVQLLQCDII